MINDVDAAGRGNVPDNGIRESPYSNKSSKFHRIGNRRRLTGLWNSEIKGRTLVRISPYPNGPAMTINNSGANK